jgi:transcriptional regulator with XRE-family HTH domain
MLRIKQIIDELGITQQTVADKTGWSKAQISLTFNNGKFPANADRFKVDMAVFAKETPAIWELMQTRSIGLADLCEKATADIPNAAGELSGLGPQWSCDEYGQDSHDYQECQICARKFEGYMAMKRGRAAVMGGAA